MRRIIILFMACISILFTGCLISCTVDDSDSYDPSNSGEDPGWYGQFNGNWIVEKQIVDTSLLGAFQQFYVAAMPDQHIVNQVFPAVAKADSVNDTGCNWGYALAGYSENSYYFNILLKSYGFTAKINGTWYQFHMNLTPDKSVAMYDKSTDAWLVLVYINQIIVECRKGDYSTWKTETINYSPDLQYQFVTIKRALSY